MVSCVSELNLKQFYRSWKDRDCTWHDLTPVRDSSVITALLVPMLFYINAKSTYDHVCQCSHILQNFFVFRAVAFSACVSELDLLMYPGCYEINC